MIAYLETNIVLTVVLFIVGLVLIMLGGDKFVDASVDISEHFGIPHVVIGATIVSLGTTLPEVLVSTTAAFQGAGDMAIGNAFGSIVCNTLLIAGVTQFFRPTTGVKNSDINWRFILFLVSYVFTAGAAYLTGGMNRLVGIILIGGFALYAYLSVKKGNSEETSEEDNDGKKEPIGKSAIIMIVCAFLLFIGARLLVDCGTIIATKLGVPAGVIAVTFVALGTSLPELVTAISSLIKGYSDVSLGNIIGANTLNLLLVIGIPATIQGISLTDNAFYLAAPFGLGAMLLLILPFFKEGRGYRWQGFLLLASYVVYTALSFTVI